MLLYLATVTSIVVLAIAMAAIFVSLNCGIHAFDPIAFYQEGQCELPQSPSEVFRRIALNGGIAGVVVVTIGSLWTVLAKRATK